jgi:antitoxin (DNA-binding transcriptional repressor) of toxin-antitoxin stability system
MRSNLVSKSEFEAKVLELFRQVECSGVSVIVTDGGKPVLEVRPYRRVYRNALHAQRGTLLRYDNPTTSISENEWETDQ